MNKQYKIGDEVLVRGIVNSEVSNGGIHILHDGVDAFYTLDQIREPQEAVVPKVVAGWLKEYRYASTLLKVLNAAEDERVVPSAVNDWILDNQRDFVAAWYDGYTIEQEKLYTVEIPNPNRSGKGHAKFRLEKTGNKVVLVKRKSNECYQNKPNQKLTESEIKQDFEWAWQWAELVKVE